MDEHSLKEIVELEEKLKKIKRLCRLITADSWGAELAAIKEEFFEHYQTVSMHAVIKKIEEIASEP